MGINEENYRISQLADLVKETVPNCRIEYAKDAGPDKRNYQVDFSKIKSILPDFQPEWTARKGADQLYTSYQQFGLTMEEFEGSRYQRISHIRELLSSGKLNSELKWADNGKPELSPK